MDPGSLKLIETLARLGLSAIEILSVIAVIKLYIDRNKTINKYEKMMGEMIETQTAIAIGLGIKLPERKGEKDE